jgi:hypothetical protein
MRFHFDLAQDHLRAELFGRQAAEETQQFVAALLAEIGRTAARRVLIWMRNSRPIFRDEFKQLSSLPDVHVALLADSDEVRASHQYLEVLAAQQGAKVRAFRDEARALAWLRAIPPETP